RGHPGRRQPYATGGRVMSMMEPTLVQRTREELDFFNVTKRGYIEAIMAAADMRVGENISDGLRMNARIAALCNVLAMVLANFPELREMAMKSVWDWSHEMAEDVEEARLEAPHGNA